MKPRRKYPSKNDLQSQKRSQSIDEIAEVFDVHADTAREWIKQGCPASKPKGRYVLNDGEVQAWLNANGRNAKPGRPPKKKPAEQAEDKDYWLARKYKVQALEAERTLMPVSDAQQIGASAISIFRNGALALPPKLAVQLEGLNASERQTLLENEFTHLLNELSRNLRELGNSGPSAQAA